MAKKEEWRGLWLGVGAAAGVLIAVVFGIALLVWSVRGW